MCRLTHSFLLNYANTILVSSFQASLSLLLGEHPPICTASLALRTLVLVLVGWQGKIYFMT